MVIADATGLLVAACLASASPHEVKLVEAALDSLFISGMPEKLVGDKAYHSDKFNGNILNNNELLANHPAPPQSDKTKNSGRTEAEAV